MPCRIIIFESEEADAAEVLRLQYASYQSELFTSGKSERNLWIYEKTGYRRFKEVKDESGITFVYMEKPSCNKT